MSSIVQCFAAAPHDVTVKGLKLEGPGGQAALQAQLAQLPGGCRVQLL